MGFAEFLFLKACDMVWSLENGPCYMTVLVEVACGRREWPSGIAMSLSPSIMASIVHVCRQHVQVSPLIGFASFQRSKSVTWSIRNTIVSCCRRTSVDQAARLRSIPIRFPFDIRLTLGVMMLGSICSSDCQHARLA